jgi:hypothetical protein
MSARKQGSSMETIKDSRGVIRGLSYTIPAIMVVGGILTSVIGYQFSLADVIKAGGILIILGVGIYVFEFLIFLVGYYSSENDEEEPTWLIPHTVEDED